MLLLQRVASAGLMLATTCVFATDTKQIEQWLQQMHSAAHTLNYIGTFAYQQGRQLTAMRIIHAVDPEHGERARLISQDAIGREVIRDRDRLLCILPDIHSVIVEKGRQESEFPPEFPVDIDELMDTYTFVLEKQERVTGRTAQKLVIKPKDKFRYEHRLWIDTQTGLLLQKKMYDEHKHLIEHFVFTEIQFPTQPIEDEQFEPGITSKDYKWVETGDESDPAQSRGGWTVLNLPAGFYEDVARHHRMPNTKSYIDHLVYTDGLASVSVFIEPLTAKSKKLNGASRLGAVNAYGRVTEKYHILAVGEVPQSTLRMINTSVYYKE
ncbi:MAG: MucB/RseB C-terminal domain-containing protein [Gammaproteobacteria bacterium]|nr:MucB/RseB C-terminal domain-containing protein [Gammaproteobacteria bacterium]